MSDENVSIVRRIYDALERRDDSVGELWHPDVEFDVSRDIWGAVVGGGHYRGVEGVRQWMLDLYAAWEHLDLGCEELIDAGDDRVIAVLRVRGRGRVSGIELEYSPAGIWTFRDGRVVSVVWYGSRDEALAAAGLG
jgi:ketosteroid isomerase-like protein